MNSFPWLSLKNIVLCSLPLFIAAQTNNNITLNSALTEGDESKSSWVSPSGDFAFGFQRLAVNGGFLVGIWYNKIPEKTITWSANGGVLAQQGSKLQLDKDGLVLSDPKGQGMWRTTGSGVAFGAMLDSGNLMLSDVNGDAIWHSFDGPTNTIFPSQIMSKSTAFIARFSDTNYSNGRFQFIMQADGNLVSYTINWPQHSIVYHAYFATYTVGIGYQVVFNQSGQVYVTAKNGTIFATVLSD